MFNKFLWAGVTILSLILSHSVFAANKSYYSDDRLADLIRVVEYSKNHEEISQLENRIVARSSWNVRCWIKVFDQAKICTLQKDNITVIRLNHDYSVVIGNQPSKSPKTALRVDQHPVIYTQDGSFRNALQLIEQFKRGYYVYTRFQQTHQFEDIDQQVSLMGFQDAFRQMEKQFAQLEQQKTKNSL